MTPEKISESIVAPEQDKGILIKNASNLAELYQVLESISVISGTKDSYASSELIEIIEGVKNKKFPLEAVTKTFGLRDKVYELLGDTVISSELEERKKFIDTMDVAQTLDELCAVLERAQDKFNITDDEYFNAHQAIETINAIQRGEKTIEDIVPAYGLRDKVEKLLSKEIVEKEQKEIATEPAVEQVEEIPEEKPVVESQEKVFEKNDIENKVQATPEDVQQIEKRMEEIVSNSEIVNTKLNEVQEKLYKIQSEKSKTLGSKIKGFFNGFLKKQKVEEDERVQLLKEEEKLLIQEIEELSTEYAGLLNALERK